MAYLFHALMGKISLKRYSKFLPVKLRGIFLRTAISEVALCTFCWIWPPVHTLLCQWLFNGQPGYLFLTPVTFYSQEWFYCRHMSACLSWRCGTH